MDLGIAGKWALVCAASKGLGFGCAQALVAEGVNVVINARTAGPLQQAAEKLRLGKGQWPKTPSSYCCGLRHHHARRPRCGAPCRRGAGGEF